MMENKEWKDGLPEVGEKVECYWLDEWHLVEMTGVGRSHVLFVLLKCGTEYSQFIAEAKFRPIKSPQEIERDKAIEEMLDVDMSESENVCEALYDAGYRKPLKEVSEAGLCKLIVLHQSYPPESIARELLANFTITRKGVSDE